MKAKRAKIGGPRKRAACWHYFNGEHRFDTQGNVRTQKFPFGIVRVLVSCKCGKTGWHDISTQEYTWEE